MATVIIDDSRVTPADLAAKAEVKLRLETHMDAIGEKTVEIEVNIRKAQSDIRALEQERDRIALALADALAAKIDVTLVE